MIETMDGNIAVAIKQKYEETSELLMSENRIICLSHLGVFSHDLINSIANAAEDLMISSGEMKRTVKRAFSILIEGLQNIYKHAAADEKGQQLAFLILAKNNTTYKIVFGNIIEQEEVDPTLSYLMHINAMNPDQLKLLYLDVLSREELSQKGGAGLGFLTMFIKSESQFKYGIQKVKNSKSILCIEILLNRN